MKKKEPRVIVGRVCWRCGSCGRYLPAQEFYEDRRTPNGLKSQCKTCHTRSNLKTRDLIKKRLANRAYMRRNRERNLVNVRAQECLASRKRPRTVGRRARYLLNLAVRRGDIVKPDNCSCCGRDDLILHGHHEDYSKPLDVTWLCSECHGERHQHAG